MTNNKLIDRANLKLALQENNKKVKEYVDASNYDFKMYQKYVNTDLDYGIFEPVAQSSTYITCASVKDGNLLLDEDGYIILNANKKYNIFVDLYNTTFTTGMWLVDKEGNQVSVGKSTGSLGFLNIETTKETHVAIKFNLGATLETEWCGIIVQEVGRAIIIDPLEHANTIEGLEDTPVGHIISHMGTTAPNHYLICDGNEYGIDQYPYLAQHIKDNFGITNYFGGDGETTFAVPDIDTEYTDVTPIMTGDNVPAPYVVSASSVSTSQQAYKAFNGTVDSPNDSWAASAVNAWLKIDFGKTISVVKFALTGIHTNTQYNPKDFILYGSNDDDVYHEIYVATNQTNWTSKEYREYVLEQAVQYRYFKIEITSNNGAQYSAISLLHFYAPNTVSCIKYEPTYFLNIQNTNYLSPTLYSEEERVVGCWINGKPLYEKTIVSKVPTTAQNGTISESTIYEDADIELCTSINGVVDKNGAAFNIPMYHSTGYYGVCALYINGVIIQNTCSAYSDRDLYVTIQYTKSTDAENSFTNDMIKDFIGSDNNNDDPNYSGGSNCSCPTYTDDEIYLMVANVLGGEE